MKKGIRNSYLVIVPAIFVIVCAWSNSFAQEETGLTRKQLLQMANEHYAKGKEYNQQGEYAKANEEFKKAQDLLAGLEGEGTVVLPSSQGILQTEAQAPPLAPAAMKEKKVARQETKKKTKPAKVKAPAISEEVQRDADNYFRQALAFARKGQSQEAIGAYNKAIELTADNPNLHYNLAIEYLKLNKFSEAAQIFQKVVELNPKEKDAYYNLGVLYDSYLGDKDLAKSYYTQYLKLATKSDDIKQVKEWIAQIDKEKKELQ